MGKVEWDQILWYSDKKVVTGCEAQQASNEHV